MSTGAIIAIVIGALILIALMVFLARKGREKKFEQQRIEAHEHRSEARMRARTAEREQAEADEAAARAKKSRAQAEEQAAQARRAETEAEAKLDHAHHERSQAEELHGRASELDPDENTQERGGNGNGGRNRMFGRKRNQDQQDQQDQQDERANDTGATDQVPAQGERRR